MSSRPVAKAYLVAGQADGALNTVLQADLLKDLDQGVGQFLEEDLELCRATDLTLHSSKQMARTTGDSMATMFATGRHLWLNLSGMKKDKSFLLDSLVSPSGIFGTAVDMVFERFREPPPLFILWRVLGHTRLFRPSALTRVKLLNYFYP